MLRRLGQRPERSRVPVVLLSARALELGCHAYLAKPFRPAELTRVVEGVLAASGEPT